MSGTDIGYATTRKRHWLQWVGSAIFLRACCAMSGTDLGHGAIHLRTYYAVCSTDLAYDATTCYWMCGTELAYDATICHAICGTELAYGAATYYCMSGTELAYGATSAQDEGSDQRAHGAVHSAACLRACYAMSGTDLACGVLPAYARATRCPYGLAGEVSLLAERLGEL
eukprot:2254297-Rhodomonas_salina.3